MARHGYRGYKWCVLRCAFEDRKVALSVLSRYPCVTTDPPPVYRDGAIQFEIDLGELDHPGDGPAVECVIIRELQTSVSLHVERKP